ncbi:MAG: LCP family protein [Lachnospiraceae bacterium]
MIEEKETIEKKKVSIGLTTVLTILTIVVLIFGIVVVLRMVGKQRLEQNVQAADFQSISIGVSQNEPVSDHAEGPVTLEEGQILYGGKVYEYNSDVINILIMGIDKAGGIVEATNELDGGQADALFLLVLNPHTKQIEIITINRNSMVDVDVFDKEGNYLGVYTKQIALQHGYGDGLNESCERQVHTVSRFLHNIPVHAYAAINMEAIPSLNDAVGGVTVTVLDDIIYPEYDMDLHAGEEVTLMGEKAYWYVRLRNENMFDSNTLRQERQKQYLTTWGVTAKEQATSDIRVAIELYEIVSEYMVTNLDLSSFTYLVSESVNYDFSIDNMFTVPGEAFKGNEFEEFYVDEEGLEKMLVEIFYEPVE